MNNSDLTVVPPFFVVFETAAFHVVFLVINCSPVSHNFPYGFDDAILSTNPILKNNGYKIFQKSGTMNGKNGVFEIGLTKDGIIDHRFFRPF